MIDLLGLMEEEGTFKSVSLMLGREEREREREGRVMS